MLILLTGCFGVPTDESPGITTTGTGTITGIIAAPCCDTSGEPISETSGSPEYWCYYCEKDWYLQEGVEVILTSGQVEIATTTTNENGKFIFTGVPPGKNYVITAYCPDDEIPLVKDVVPELVEGGSFNAKTTDLVSTSLGLVVDFVVYFAAWDPEDISLDKVIAAKPHFPGFPKFKKLVREVRRVLENCEDVDADVDVLEALCLAAEEISESDMGCAPGFTPVLEAEEGPDPGPGPTPPPPPVTYTLTTSVYPAGSGSVTGEGTYNSGDTAAVEATPNEGWYFFEWSGNLSGSANPTSILMNGNKSVTAHFTEEDLCADNTPPVITAVTLDGYPIESPEYLIVGTSYVFCVHADDDDILSQELTYSLTIDDGTNPPFDIDIGTNSNGFICYSVTPLFEDVGTYTVYVNVFDGCEGGTDTWEPFTIVVEPITYDLTVDILPEAAETAGASTTPATGTHTDYAAEGDSVTVEAFDPSDGSWTFVEWKDGVGTHLSYDPSYTFDMPAANVTVVAHFEVVPPPKYDLTIDIEPEAAETAGASTTPATGTHTDYAAAGDSVTVVASDPSDGSWTFVEWKDGVGAHLSYDPSYTFDMPAANVTVVAHFEVVPPPKYDLTIDIEPEAAETAGASTTPATGTHTDYAAAGDSVTVVASDPSDGSWTFVEWKDGVGAHLSYDPSYTFDMPAANVTVVANFRLANIITSIAIGGWENASCNPNVETPHWKYIYEESNPSGISETIELQWLTAGTPNVKSVHFFVNVDVDDVITYRYTINVLGTIFSNDIVLLGGGYVSSDCMEIPKDGSNTYASAFYIEIDVNGARTYTIYLCIPPTTP